MIGKNMVCFGNFEAYRGLHKIIPAVMIIFMAPHEWNMMIVMICDTAKIIADLKMQYIWFSKVDT